MNTNCRLFVNTFNQSIGNDLMKILNGKRLIFLISQPRSGSTMMQRIIGCHHDIHTSSETWIMLHPMYALRESGIETDFCSDLAVKASLGFISQLPGGMEEYNDLMRRTYSQMYQRVLDVTGKSYYLDKSPRYYLIIKELYKLFPEAKFIFLFRNPLSVLVSIISRWTQGDWYRLSEFRSDLINAPDHLLRGGDLLKKKSITIRYEEFLADPENIIKTISSYLNVKNCPEIMNYENGNTDGKSWEFGDQYTVNEKNQPDMSHVNKWQELLYNPQAWRVINEYFEFLGKNRIEKMGYGYDLCRKIIEESKAIKLTLRSIVWGFGACWIIPVLTCLRTEI